MRQVAEGHGRHSRVPVLGRLERLRRCRQLGVDPVLVVKALHQLPGGSDSPRELYEDLVLLGGPRVDGVGPRLTVVVAEVLVPGEEPQPITQHWTTEIRGGVVVPIPLVPAGWLAGPGIGQVHRLTRQGRRLSVVRRVIQESVAALPGDDVDDRSLHVAELRRCAHALNLHLLNEVDARLGSRLAAARAGEVGAVDRERVLVRAGSERGDAVRGAAARRGGRDARGGPDEVEHAESPHRDQLEIVGAEAGLETAASRFETRAGALDDQ